MLTKSRQPVSSVLALWSYCANGDQARSSGPFPVDDVDSDDKDEGGAEEDRVAVLQAAWRFVMGTNNLLRGRLDLGNVQGRALQLT
jgi:hypothetical protein